MASRFRRYAKAHPWGFELIAAAVGLFFGAALMPILIFFAGVGVLGRFEGASLGRQYSSILEGLREPSIASWIVLLGPYGLYVLFKALRVWWRTSANWVS